MLPGGLGAMEASLVFQLRELGVAPSLSLPVVVATRAVTLWLGMSIGVLSLLLVTRETK